MNSCGPRAARDLSPRAGPWYPGPRYAGPRSEPARRIALGAGLLVLAMLCFAVLNAFCGVGPAPAEPEVLTGTAMAPVGEPDGADPEPGPGDPVLPPHAGAAGGADVSGSEAFGSETHVSGSGDHAAGDPGGTGSDSRRAEDPGSAGAEAGVSPSRGARSEEPARRGSARRGSGSGGSEPGGSDSRGSDSGGSDSGGSDSGGSDSGGSGSGGSGSGASEPPSAGSLGASSAGGESSLGAYPGDRESPVSPTEQGTANSFPGNPDSGHPRGRAPGPRSYSPGGSIASGGSIGTGRAGSSGGVIGAVRPSARAARVLPPNFNPPVRRRRTSSLDGSLPGGLSAGGLSSGGDAGRETDGGSGGTGGGSGRREPQRLPRGGDLDAGPGPRENNTVERRSQVGENQVNDNQVVNGRAGNEGGREMSREEVVEMVQSVLDRLGIRLDSKDLDSGGPIRVSGNGWTITRDGRGN